MPLQGLKEFVGNLKKECSSQPEQQTPKVQLKIPTFGQKGFDVHS